MSSVICRQIGISSDQFIFNFNENKKFQYNDIKIVHEGRKL